jgi:pimeloyl-ACP methyl ester carboxylesterase
MRFLLPNRLLVYYDMRAAGRSEFGSIATSTITVGQHAFDLGTLIDWVGTQGANTSEVDLVGHGYGALVATLFAAANPQRVAHLVLTTPFPATVFQLAQFNSTAESRLSTADRSLINLILMQPDCRGDRDECLLMIWNIEGPYYMCEPNRPRFSMLRFEFGSYRAEDFVENDLRNNRYDFRPQFAMVASPTTIIQGVCDPTPPETVLSYSSSIAGSRLEVLQQSGHFPMVEQRDEYQRIVLDALND